MTCSNLPNGSASIRLVTQFQRRVTLDEWLTYLAFVNASSNVFILGLDSNEIDSAHRSLSADSDTAAQIRGISADLSEPSQREALVSVCNIIGSSFAHLVFGPRCGDLYHRFNFSH